MADGVIGAAIMTATPIPISAPDGSRTETCGGCVPRPGVLLPEDGPGLGAARDGRGDGSADWVGRGDGSAGREGREDGPGVRPGRGLPGCGPGACAPAGCGNSSTQAGMIRFGSVRERPAGWGLPPWGWGTWCHSPVAPRNRPAMSPSPLLACTRCTLALACAGR